MHCKCSDAADVAKVFHKLTLQMLSYWGSILHAESKNRLNFFNVLKECVSAHFEWQLRVPI